MNSPNSNNVAYLQSALRNLEDRYKKLQNRADSLQNENERLVASRTELMLEVERLQDQQIRLRERNLRLTQEFHSKQQECSLLAEKLTLFARGRVPGFPNTSGSSSSFKSSGLVEVEEDADASSSLMTVELHGGCMSRPSTALNVSSRTWSEPNLLAIQKELELVRKGLWSPAIENGKSESTVEELSSKIISSLKKGQTELEEQISKMVGIQQISLGTEDFSSSPKDVTEDAIFIDEVDSITYIQHCTRSTVALHDKLRAQNQTLRKLHKILKTPRGNITCKLVL